MSKQTDFTKQISFSGAKGRGVQDSFTTVAKSGFVRYCRLTIVLNAMIRNREIKRWCQRVAREFRPEKIVLFGSYVRGTPTEDSDVDVLVVMPLTRGQRDVRQAVAIRERVRAALPMDVIVRSPQQIACRLALGDGFITDVLRHGRLMYEGEHA